MKRWMEEAVQMGVKSDDRTGRKDKQIAVCCVVAEERRGVHLRGEAERDDGMMQVESNGRNGDEEHCEWNESHF